MKKLICSLVYMYALFICRIIVSTSNYSTLIENKNLENVSKKDNNSNLNEEEKKIIYNFNIELYLF